MTTDNAPVTAQDFLDSAVESWDSGGNITVDNVRTKRSWENLLSRARQQAFSARRASQDLEKKVKEAREKAIEECVASVQSSLDGYTNNGRWNPEQLDEHDAIPALCLQGVIKELKSL